MPAGIFLCIVKKDIAIRQIDLLKKYAQALAPLRRVL